MRATSKFLLRKSFLMIVVFSVFVSHSETGLAANFSPTNKEDSAQSQQYLLSTPVNIQYDEDRSFSADQLLSRVADEFYGAFFICNPFCNVIGMKLTGDWKPDLKQVKITSQNMKLMDVDDPLFKILFPDKAKEAAEASLNRSRRRREREAKGKELAQKIDDQSNQPKPPKTAFANAFRISPGLRYTIVNQKSNSPTVQSQFTGGSVENLSLGLGYMRGAPLRFLGRWWQFEVGYDMDIFGTKAKQASGSDFSLSKTSLFLNGWLRQKGFSWGPSLRMDKESYKVSENTLNSFSFDESTTYLGVVFKYQRFRLDVDYGLQYKITEQQPFRDQLTSAAIYSLQGSYCQVKKIYNDVGFIPCYAFGLLLSDNAATLKPEYSPANVALKRQDIFISAIIHFGEDFLR